MTQLLQNKWVAVALGVVTYALTTWFALQGQRKAIGGGMAPAAKVAGHAASGPSWTFENPEMTQLILELKDQREALRLRASQLDELEARLKAERQEIYAVTQSVHQLRIDLDAMVTRITAEEAVNLKKLVKVYATMTPEGAARILKEMPDEQVVKLLALMREAESARILEAMAQGTRNEPHRVALLSDRLRLVLSAPAKTPAP
jgi:flagellar motility protein MotE (MotC chaperone)